MAVHRLPLWHLLSMLAWPGCSGPISGVWEVYTPHAVVQVAMLSGQPDCSLTSEYSIDVATRSSHRAGKANQVQQYQLRLNLVVCVHLVVVAASLIMAIMMVRVLICNKQPQHQCQSRHCVVNSHQSSS